MDLKGHWREWATLVVDLNMLHAYHESLDQQGNEVYIMDVEVEAKMREDIEQAYHDLFVDLTSEINHIVSRWEQEITIHINATQEINAPTPPKSPNQLLSFSFHINKPK